MDKRYWCGSLTSKNIGEKVILYGWVHSRRDHGGVIFIDLRDREGLVQVVFGRDEHTFPAELMESAKQLNNEDVIKVVGIVTKRPEGTNNPKLSTGKIEIIPQEITILNRSKVPIFEISDFISVNEELRLQYRYLDLRRTKVKENIILRHKISQAIRNYLTKEGFIEIETPFLTKSTPEGARDYLVPSRLTPGTFYALPQSPQLFKQILMVAGFDKYFQIVRCFRDEDLRADRQPEFTQVDLEMSFVNQEDVMSIVEQMLSNVINEVISVSVKTPFERISYTTAMEQYGTDKPDIRFGMKINNLSDIFRDTQFKIFSTILSQKGIVAGISTKDIFSRQKLDDLKDYVTGLGLPGLIWLRITEKGIDSPISKFLTEKQIEMTQAKFGAKAGDIIFLIAAEKNIALSALGELRKHLFPKQTNTELSFVWVIDFPLFEYSETEKRLVSTHHPFTAPLQKDIPLLDSSPEKVIAAAYDLVLNGIELGGGSIRIHTRQLQEKIFSILHLPSEEIKERFGFLLEALEYGAPPHGGIALGLDRLLAILLNEETIREVIPFPKTQKGTCLLTGAPTRVSETQLKELYIQPMVNKKSSLGK